MQSNFPKLPLLLSIIFFIISAITSLSFYKAISSSEKESQLKEEKWQIETMRRDEIRSLDNSVRIIEGERAQLETHFAKGSDVVSFLDTIEGLASKTGAKAEVTSADISEDRTALLVGMKASGTFSSFYKFLTLLENSPYELGFIGVDMRKETGFEVGGKNIAFPKWDIFFKIKLISFSP